MLKKGGEIVYFGSKDDFESYCSENGIGERAPGNNLADFALSAVCSDREEPDAAALFRQSSLAASALEFIEKQDAESMKSSRAKSSLQVFGLMCCMCLRWACMNSICAYLGPGRTRWS